nr:putative nuclease HARBI1 isoform X2 [Tanacetum cinerariifolium]
MNPYFAMHPNDDEEERQPNSFDVDDESDVYFLQQAYEYHECLVEEENCPALTRNPIHRDREGAEDCLMGDYFDDPSTIRQLAYGNTPDAFDEHLQMSERTTRANNDINVLDNSLLFDDILDDKAPVAPFVRQESARKDTERAFGVLQGRCGIIQQPARQYHVNNICRIMYSCFILHNMILKDQKMTVTDWNDAYANPSRNMQLEEINDTPPLMGFLVEGKLAMYHLSHKRRRNLNKMKGRRSKSSGKNVLDCDISPTTFDVPLSYNLRNSTSGDY